MKQIITFLTLIFFATTIFAQINMPLDDRNNNFANEHFNRQHHEKDMLKQKQFIEKEFLEKFQKQIIKTTYKGAANETDSLALIALYNATNGDNWTDNTNWLTGNVADWHGIALDEEGRVSWVYLIENQLTGSIPSEIGNLQSLTYFDLSYNNLTGIIPAEISNLTNLTKLHLGNNHLAGKIPAGIGNLSSLQELYLYNNSLTGSIPSEIGNLINLSKFNLAGNKLTGKIPTEIGNLNNLQYLSLEENQLSDTIPLEIGNLTNLIELYLYHNFLTGRIPSEIGNLNNLKLLFLEKNQLSGSIPTELGKLTNLQSLGLDYNQLTDLPDLTQLTILDELYIDNNKFIFEDIEPNINVGDIIYYSPQAKVGCVEHYTPDLGEIINLSVTDGGEHNTYKWYKNDVEINGALSDTYTIESYRESDSGVYICEIKNTIATKLTLISRKKYVGGDVTTFNISAIVNSTERGTINGAGTYNGGETATLVASANVGYCFKNWTENGTVVSVNSEYSFNVNEDRTLIASFELESFTVSATSNPTSGGTVSGANIYNYGDTATLTEITNTGYNFVNWTSDTTEVSTDTTYSFTVTSDTIFVANFEEKTSITEFENQISFTLYPNPVKNIVNIKLSNFKVNNAQDIQITMFDYLGKISNINTKKINSDNIQIDVSKKSAGIYFLRISENNGLQKMCKFIIIK